MDQVRERIRRRLEELGRNATEVSISAGLGRDALRDILRGKSARPHFDTFAAIAAALDMTADELLGNAPPAVDLKPIQVVGAVQAGRFTDALEWPLADRYSIAVPVPEGLRHLQPYGVEVRGDSMNELYPQGTVAVVVKLIKLGRDPMDGERVVCIRRGDGEDFEATIKELRRRADGSWWLYPRTTNPELMQPWRLRGGPDADFDNEDLRLDALVIGSYRPEV